MTTTATAPSIHFATNVAADVACGDTDDAALFTFRPELVTCPACCNIEYFSNGAVVPDSMRDVVTDKRYVVSEACHLVADEYGTHYAIVHLGDLYAGSEVVRIVLYTGFPGCPARYYVGTRSGHTYIAHAAYPATGV
jgi:hypothetical protein